MYWSILQTDEPALYLEYHLETAELKRTRRKTGIMAPSQHSSKQYDTASILIKESVRACVPLLSSKPPLRDGPFTTPQALVLPVLLYTLVDIHRTLCTSTIPGQRSATQCQHLHTLCLTYTIHSVVASILPRTGHRCRVKPILSKNNFHNDSLGSARLANAS